MSSKREQQRFHDIVDNIDAIVTYVDGADFAAFSADRKTVDAVERCLLRVSEAVVKIGTDRMEELAPELSVHRARALGNVLRHEYDSIDLSLIYNLITQDLPPLRTAIITALKEPGRA